MSSLCGLKFDCNILNIGQTLFVDYIKTGYGVLNDRLKFHMMLFGVSVISERNNILTFKKLEFVLQANQWRWSGPSIDGGTSFGVGGPSRSGPTGPQSAAAFINFS